MPYDAYELLQEARVKMRERQPGLAVSLLERARELEPRRGSILETLGIAYYNSGDNRRALEAFGEALEIDPTNHYARYGLSRCLHREGKLEKAIGQVKLAAVMAPEFEIYEKALRRYQGDLEADMERRKP